MPIIRAEVCVLQLIWQLRGKVGAEETAGIHDSSLNAYFKLLLAI